MKDVTTEMIPFAPLHLRIKSRTQRREGARDEKERKSQFMPVSSITIRISQSMRSPAGGAGFRVKELCELKDVLEKAISAKKPAIVDIETDPGRF